MPKSSALIHKKHCMQWDQRPSNLLSCLWGEPVTSDHRSIKYKACIQGSFFTTISAVCGLSELAVPSGPGFNECTWSLSKNPFLPLAFTAFCGNEPWVHCVVQKRMLSGCFSWWFNRVTLILPLSNVTMTTPIPCILATCDFTDYIIYVLSHHFFLVAGSWYTYLFIIWDLFDTSVLSLTGPFPVLPTDRVVKRVVFVSSVSGLMFHSAFLPPKKHTLLS